jgi:hypothetical protein
MQILAHSVEQSLAATKQDGDKVKLHLIHETSCKILLGHIGPAAERYIFAISRPECPLKGIVNAIRHKVKRRSTT